MFGFWEREWSLLIWRFFKLNFLAVFLKWMFFFPHWCVNRFPDLWRPERVTLLEWGWERDFCLEMAWEIPPYVLNLESIRSELLFATKDSTEESGRCRLDFATNGEPADIWYLLRVFPAWDSRGGTSCIVRLMGATQDFVWMIILEENFKSRVAKELVLLNDIKTIFQVIEKDYFHLHLNMATRER